MQQRLEISDQDRDGRSASALSQEDRPEKVERSPIDKKIRFYNWALGLLLLTFALFKAYTLLGPKYLG